MNSRRSYSSSQVSYSNITQTNPVSGTTFFLQYKEEAYKQDYQENHSGTPNTTDSGDRKEEQTEVESNHTDQMNNLMEKMQSTGRVRQSSLQESISALQKIRQQTIHYLLYILFGRRVADNNLSSWEEVSSTRQEKSGSNYSFFYYSEDEVTCFDTEGTVKTADGRELPFHVSVEMSRSFVQASESIINYGQPVLCDPLVINLDNNVADVKDQKFLFDLDADGEEESISMLGNRSGYLALDENEDGIINDGKELFGTKSGNGFADLSQYDKDGNGWIDEADEIFSKLKIWIQEKDGNRKLLSLSEAGVGAIYLGYENTDFSLNRLQDNATNAIIRKTGIFLYENGDSGTVQQLDLAT